jgi:hypothetical protein
VKDVDSTARTSVRLIASKSINLGDKKLTTVKKEDYLLASLIFVGYLTAALVVVVIIALIGGGTGVLGFFAGVLFTVGVYQTWKNMPGRSRASGKT